MACKRGAMPRTSGIGNSAEEKRKAARSFSKSSAWRPKRATRGLFSKVKPNACDQSPPCSGSASVTGPPSQLVRKSVASSALRITSDASYKVDPSIQVSFDQVARELRAQALGFGLKGLPANGTILRAISSSSPILVAADVPETIRFYTEVLGFGSSWIWGDPPTFGAAISRLDYGYVQLQPGARRAG